MENSKEVSMEEEKKHLRTIRSFVKREGRLTKGQERILEESPYLIPHEMVESEWDLDALFGRENRERTLEIGFGNGASLVEMAEMHPERDFLGVEVHRPGVGHLLLAVEEKGLTNLRAIDYDAVHIIDKCLPAESLECVQIFFPDPWHKKRHNKRRLVQVPFVNKLLRVLQHNGRICMATDWEPYAEHMMEVMNEIDALENTFGGGFASDSSHRPTTKFERRGIRLGHGVWDLIFKKIQ